MRLKTVSRTLFLGVLLALLANFVFLILIKRADDSATRAAAAREETVLAVEKLRRETEMLRRLVRLCHPDRHDGSEAANKATAWLLAQRNRMENRA